MQLLLIFSVLISVSAASLLNQYIMRMATRGLDPLTRSLIQPVLNEALLDMDGGGSGGSGSQSPYGGGSMLGASPFGPWSPYSNMIGGSPFDVLPPNDMGTSANTIGGSPFDLFPPPPNDMATSSNTVAGSPFDLFSPNVVATSSNSVGGSPVDPFPSNKIATSSVNPAKEDNPYNSAPGTPGAMISPQAVPTRSPFAGTMGMPYSSPRSYRNNFFQNFMMFRMLQMFDFI